MFIEKTTEKKTTIKIHPQKFWHSYFDFRSHLRLVDYATFIYLGVIAALILFFHNGINYWPYLILAHIAVIAFLCIFIKLVENSWSNTFLLFIRGAYPIFLCSFMFLEINLLMNILFPFWLEKWLIRWDLALFGTHPTVWIQQIFQPWLTEFMAFSYWSYYILIPLTALLLFLRKNKTLFNSYVFHLSFTLYLCYFLFLFLTARGPHETLAHLHAERVVVGFFDSFVYSIQDRASVSGAAFPSSHVAAVWVAWIFLYKFNKWVGRVSLILIVSLSFSVVYMQYHYAVDSIAGILLVCMVYPVARFIEKKNKPGDLLQN